MELDFVDPPAEAVMRAKDGRKAVGLKAEPDHAGRADDCPKAIQPLEAPLAPFADDRLFEGGIRLERVVVLECRRLIFDDVRLVSRHRLRLDVADARTGIESGHDGPPKPS